MRKLKFPVQFRESRDTNGRLQESWVCSDGMTFYDEDFARMMEKRLRGEKAKVSSKSI